MAQCIDPKSIPHPHGTTKAVRLTVPCGRCINCLQSRRGDWTIRLMEELEACKTAYFVTITYNDESLPFVKMGSKLYKSLDKDQIRGFLKRLRTKVDRYYEEKGEDAIERTARRLKWPIKYYLVGEYGPNTFRPHYHAIFFNLPKRSAEWLSNAWCVEKKSLGFVHVGQVTQASIHYTTKYVLDGLLSTESFSELKDSEGEWIPRKPFALISNGIGKEYVTKNKKYHSDNGIAYYTFPGNYKQRLPRYYKDKMLNDYQKEAAAEKAEKSIIEKEKERIRVWKKKGISEAHIYEAYRAKLENTIKKSKQRKI